MNYHMYSQYVKISNNNNYPLTPLETQILNCNGNIQQIHDLLINTKIIILKFSEIDSIFVEKQILDKIEFFKELFDFYDDFNDNNFIKIPLSNILDNYSVVYNIILVVAHKIINNSIFNNIFLPLNITIVIDYLKNVDNKNEEIIKNIMTNIDYNKPLNDDITLKDLDILSSIVEKYNVDNGVKIITAIFMKHKTIIHNKYNNDEILDSPFFEYIGEHFCKVMNYDI